MRWDFNVIVHTGTLTSCFVPLHGRTIISTYGRLGPPVRDSQPIASRPKAQSCHASNSLYMRPQYSRTTHPGHPRREGEQLETTDDLGATWECITPVKVGSHTVHLYPYLYVVFRRMRGAVSLFVSNAARKENKKSRRRRMQRNQHFPTVPFN
jgi:hypothetical protein